MLLSAPRGNFTIMINPRLRNGNPRALPEEIVSVEEDDTIVVKFILYRLNPVEIHADAGALNSKALVGMKFKLPVNGSHYVDERY